MLPTPVIENDEENIRAWQWLSGHAAYRQKTKQEPQRTNRIHGMFLIMPVQRSQSKNPRWWFMGFVVCLI
jgi:hypothetical protein